MRFVALIAFIMIGSQVSAQTANPAFLSVGLQYLSPDDGNVPLANLLPAPVNVVPNVPGVRGQTAARSFMRRNVINHRLECDAWRSKEQAVVKLQNDFYDLKARLGLAVRSGNVAASRLLQDQVDIMAIRRDSALVLATLSGSEKIEASVELDASSYEVDAHLAGAPDAQYTMTPVEMKYGEHAIYLTPKTKSSYFNSTVGPLVLSFSSTDFCMRSARVVLSPYNRYCASVPPLLHISAPRREICTPNDNAHNSVASVTIDYDKDVRVTFLIGDNPKPTAEEVVAVNGALNRVLDAKLTPLILDVAGTGDFAVDDTMLDSYLVDKDGDVRRALSLLRTALPGSGSALAYTELKARLRQDDCHYRFQDGVVYFDFITGTAKNAIGFRRRGASYKIAEIIVGGKRVFAT